MSLTEHTRFDFIRYANCWEDPDILLSGLNPPENSRILSIGSAGDNSFSLLMSNPEIVIAADINPVQLYLIELKKEAIRLLDQVETLQFLGFMDSSDRLRTYEKVKIKLSNEARTYWDNNISLIRSGVIHQGKFEKYFQTFVRYILPLIHSQKTVHGLLELKDQSAQKLFYDKIWNTTRWRFLFKFFFSKTVMGYLGRDPNFLKEVKLDVGSFIFNRAALHLSSIGAQDNFILRYNLTGAFRPLLPHYLRLENYDIIKSNLDRLVLFKGFAEDALELHGPVHSMNLSNIFEYMDMETYQKSAGRLTSHLLRGGRMAYWNLMVPRKISDLKAPKITYLHELSEALTLQDKGFFYNQFIVEQAL